MTLIDQLGTALGLATLAGLNLYLTVFVAGLAVRFHWIELSGTYESMEGLGHPWVIGVAGGMFLIQFVADKIPWVDSIWDVVHTVIRPAGAIFLALAVLGKMDPTAATIAALLAGGAALSTHGTKAGIRAFLNLSPEPVTNTVASIAEDGFVLGGLGLIGLFPTAAFFVFIAIVVLCTAAAVWLWRAIFRLRRRLKAKDRSGDAGSVLAENDVR
ncbi:MAG: DUF4126 domain-containing protein [Luteolibacter sp.]